MRSQRQTPKAFMSGRCMVCARSRTRYQTQQATAAATLFFDDLLERQTANHVSGDLSNSRRSALHWANELGTLWHIRHGSPSGAS